MAKQIKAPASITGTVSSPYGDIEFVDGYSEEVDDEAAEQFVKTYVGYEIMAPSEVASEETVTVDSGFNPDSIPTLGDRKSELKDFIKKYGIDAGGAKTKEELLAAIHADKRFAPKPED